MLEYLSRRSNIWIRPRSDNHLIGSIRVQVSPGGVASQSVQNITLSPLIQGEWRVDTEASSTIKVTILLAGRNKVLSKGWTPMIFSLAGYDKVQRLDIVLESRSKQDVAPGELIFEHSSKQGEEPPQMFKISSPVYNLIVTLQ